MSHRTTTTFTYNPHATFKTWHDQEANHQFPKGRKILFISLLKIIKKKPVVANSSGQLEILLLAVQFTFDILISTLSLWIISYLHTQHIICNQKKIFLNQNHSPNSKSIIWQHQDSIHLSWYCLLVVTKQLLSKKLPDL